MPGGSRDRPEARGHRRRRRREPAPGGAALAGPRPGEPAPCEGRRHPHDGDGLRRRRAVERQARVRRHRSGHVRLVVPHRHAGTTAARRRRLGRLWYGVPRGLRHPGRAHGAPADGSRPEGRGRAAPHRDRLQQPDPGRAASHRGRSGGDRQSGPDLGAVRSVPHQGRLDPRPRDRRADVRAMGQAHGRGPLAHRSAVQRRPGPGRPRRDYLQAHVRVDGRAHDRGGARRARSRQDRGGATLLTAAGAEGRARSRCRPARGHRVSGAASAGAARANPRRPLRDARTLPPPRSDAG